VMLTFSVANSGWVNGRTYFMQISSSLHVFLKTHTAMTFHNKAQVCIPEANWSIF